MTLYLASGTDQKPMREEAELLDVAKYFDGNVFGALDDYKKFSKKILIDKLIRESDFAGEEFVGFGDGFVEIENVKQVGGVAVGIASDEPDCLEVERIEAGPPDWRGRGLDRAEFRRARRAHGQPSSLPNKRRMYMATQSTRPSTAPSCIMRPLG